VDAIPKIVIENPYRILGVYANSKRQVILANKGKATAFLRVGKMVEYPLDLKGLLPPLIRTLKSIDEAESHLAIAKEQIMYAQFWFVKITPIDDVAFNHLSVGDIDKAISIWSKQDNLSSLQNKMICHLIKGSLSESISIAQQLYNKFGDCYIEKLDSSCTLKMTGVELRNLFINSLGDCVGMTNLLSVATDAVWKSYISSQKIGPLIANISAEVERTKRVDHKDAKARIDAARNLVRATRDLFAQLKTILPANDPQFVMIADKLGLEILQCSIDYFNNSNEDGRHQTAMKMQKYALSIVEGTMARQRCQENIDILKELIDRLPPESVKGESERLMMKVTIFSLQSAGVDDVLNFLKDTCDDLVGIKTKLGASHTFYIKQATMIAQVALGKSIDALNKAQENEFPKLDGLYRNEAVGTMKHVFEASWRAILWIELIDADIEFKNDRLKPNKAALKKILDEVDAFASDVPLSFSLIRSRSVFQGCAANVIVDVYIYYTEDEMFAVCKNINTCEKYIKKFPDGKHINEVRKKLILLKDDNKFKNAKTRLDYMDYLKAYPKGRHAEEARKKIATIQEEERKKAEQEIAQLSNNIDRCTNISECINLLYKCKKFSNEQLVNKVDDKFFCLCKSIDDYNSYLKIMGYNAHHREAAQLAIRRKKIRQFITPIVISLLVLVLGGIAINRCTKQAALELAEKQRVADSLIAEANHVGDSLVNFCNDEEQLRTFVNTYNGYYGVNMADVAGCEGVRRVQERLAIIEAENEQLRLQEEAERLRQEEERRIQEEERRRQEEQQMWGTESRAWRTATSQGTMAAYNEYLQRYPQGRHKSQADQKIIDLEVQAVINSGDYGYLPPSQRISYGTSATSSVHIRNSSGSTITILYSGTRSMRVVLSPHQSQTISLPSGSYRVVATAPGVRSFYGTENLTGGDYESEYYITRY
jgi:hypothetical protein